MYFSATQIAILRDGDHDSNGTKFIKFEKLMSHLIEGRMSNMDVGDIDDMGDIDETTYVDEAETTENTNNDPAFEGGADDEDDVEESDFAETVNDELPAKMIIVKAENRITPAVMTEYEQAEYVSIRCAMIANDGYCFADVSHLLDPGPVKMAEEELNQRKCPIAFTRFLGCKKENDVLAAYYELWSPNEMGMSVQY